VVEGAGGIRLEQKIWGNELHVFPNKLNRG
jgi:hypothetical protein